MDEYIPPKIEGGYVLMARAITESSLIKMRGEDVKVAIFLMGKANHKNYKWYDQWQKMEIIVKRGECITSYWKIAEAIKESIKTVRTSIKRLSQGESGNDGFLKFITANEPKRAHAYLHINLCKFDTYNNPNNYMGTRRALDGHSTGTPWAEGGHSTGTRRATNNKTNNPNNPNNLIPKGIVDFIDTWNEICGMKLPKASLTKKRTQQIRIRIREHDLEWWKSVMQEVLNNPFLLGNNDRGWRANIDWLIRNDTNGQKVLEGFYKKTNGGKDGSKNRELGAFKGDPNRFDKVPIKSVD